jgi:tRNA(Arg) A34 adenosine deaminase TadA
MLATAYDEAVLGLSEGGIPIGAALYLRDGTLISSGHNRRVQERDASVHAETDAFRKAGRRRDYPDTVMVTTLSPCWYCSGLVRQFNIGAVVIGEATTSTAATTGSRTGRRDPRARRPGLHRVAGHVHPRAPRPLERGHRAVASARVARRVDRRRHRDRA